MKVLIVGKRDCQDKSLICSAINECLEENNIKPSTIICGEEKGFDRVVLQYAKDNGYNAVTFPIEWSNTKDIPKEELKSRFNKWKKVNEYYDPKAAFKRNDKMLKFCDIVIIISLGTNECSDFYFKCKKLNKTFYEYSPSPINSVCEFGYNFWE